MLDPQSAWPHASTMLDWMETEGPCGGCQNNTDPDEDGGCGILATACLPEPIEEWDLISLDVQRPEREEVERWVRVTCTAWRPRRSEPLPCDFDS